MKRILLITFIPIFTYSAFAQAGEKDVFDSNRISLILAWVISIPVLVGVIKYLLQLLIFKKEGHGIFFYWIILNFLLFSPIRYVFLQVFIATAYPVQSFGALFSSFFLALYLPVIFTIFWGVTVGLPLFSLVWISGLDNPSKIRMFLAGILAPFIIGIGGQLFYFAVPYSAYSIQWISPLEIIRATNGPAVYYYKFFVEPLEPELIIQNLRESPASYAGRTSGTFGMTGILPTLDVVEDWKKRKLLTNERFHEGLSSKERLRLHVATTYLSKEFLSKYVNAVHPEFADRQGERQGERLNFLTD